MGFERHGVDHVDRDTRIGDRDLRHRCEALGRQAQKHFGIHIERAGKSVFERIGRFLRIALLSVHTALDAVDELHDKTHQIILLQHQLRFTPTWSNARSVACRPFGVRMIRPCWMR